MHNPYAQDLKNDVMAVLTNKVGIAILTFALGGGTGTLIHRSFDVPTREQYAAIIKGQDDMLRMIRNFETRLRIIEEERRDEKLKRDILGERRGT